MSEKTDRWLTIHAPVALSLIAILASGSVAFGATQSTTDNNAVQISELSEDLDKLEDRLILRLDRQDARLDKVINILLAGRQEAKPTANEPEDATSR
jgi:hypothetical protein